MGSVDGISAKSSRELYEKVAALRKELVEYVFDSKSGKLVSGARHKEIKKEIARVLTVLSWRRKRGSDV